MDDACKRHGRVRCDECAEMGGLRARLAEAEAFIAEHKCGTCGGIRVKESELCSCHQACVTAATYPVIADGCFTGDTITIEITDDGDTP